MIESPNYTQIPNIFIDELMPDLGLAEMKVLIFIYRKTFGWHKKRDRISISQIEQGTKLGKQHICNAVKDLCEKKLIKKEVEGEIGRQSTYYEPWIKESSTNNTTLPPPVTQSNPPSNVTLPTKETLTKETLTKEKKIERVLSTTELGPPPSHPHFFSSFSENELKYIYQQLEKKKVAHDKIASALSFSLDDEFWRKTIKTPDGFLKNFFRICDYLPKAFDEMNEEEQFRYAIKEIHKEFPLAKKCLIVHSEERCVQETGYGHHYSMEIGVDEFYRRVMWRYGKERTFRGHRSPM